MVPAFNPCVSIHARHCWRANPLLQQVAITPAHVSIHARHCWRANPQAPRLNATGKPFQSTPAIAGGRIRCIHPVWAYLVQFQSTPAIAGGRIPGVHQGQGQARQVFQSTPAIAGGRIRHVEVTRPNGDGFNPRPPLLAGESSWYRLACLSSSLFQSTPAIAGGRIPALLLRSASFSLFQSTPAIAGGRILPVISCVVRGTMFQSTPAIAGGRIQQPQLLGLGVLSVSIHARHCWRANPGGVGLHLGAKVGFNPRPPLLAGESPFSALARRPSRSFNPRPPLLAGESSALCRGARLPDVSIHARHCWRANPLGLPGRGLRLDCFNPRPPLLAGESGPA